MNFVGVYNAPAFVSMSGLACGVTACWLGLQGQPEFAVVALIWAGVFDLFDGMVARWQQRSELENGFGIQFDSLIDMISFGIAPVMIVYSLGASGIFTFCAGLFYVSAAAQRLAYFNVAQNEAKGALRVYTGLPVTFSALIFGVAFGMSEVLSQHAFSLAANMMLLIVGLLFITPLKIPKPTGFIYILMPTLALCSTILWIYFAIVEG